MSDPLVIAPCYRFNALNYQEYLNILSQGLDGGVKPIIFDFTNVEFMDTYGLSVLIKGFKLAENAGVSLQVRGVRHEAIKSIFRVTNIERFLPVEYVNSYSNKSLKISPLP